MRVATGEGTRRGRCASSRSTARCERGRRARRREVAMAQWEFKLPDIGEGVVEGEIVKWLVKPGDEVGEDQPLVEVMTDKATVTIPSPRRGKVVQVIGKEGDIAKVHSTLVVLDVDSGA